MQMFRVFLMSKESWLKLHKPNTIAYDILAEDEGVASLAAINQNTIELGENDYHVNSIICLS